MQEVRLDESYLCILSDADDEYTSEQVMAWLWTLGVKAFRVNGQQLTTDEKQPFTASLDSDGTVQIRLPGGYDPLAVSVVWFRRWANSHEYAGIDLFHGSEESVAPNIFSSLSHLTAELRAASFALFKSMKGSTWLGDPSKRQLNKFNTLIAAAKAGLKIPPTLLTSNTEELAAFRKRHGSLIVKPASDLLICYDHDGPITTFTSRIDELQDWTGSFPALFQKEIDKEYEVRSFYLYGKCYSMAIFSQTDACTSVDFRRVGSVPNRMVPYSLPEHVGAAIGRLMTLLDLDTGSIDLIRDPSGQFIFLEVNPVGQFGMVSGPCNYHLDYEVAIHLRDIYHSHE